MSDPNPSPLTDQEQLRAMLDNAKIPYTTGNDGAEVIVRGRISHPHKYDLDEGLASINYTGSCTCLASQEPVTCLPSLLAVGIG